MGSSYAVDVMMRVGSTSWSTITMREKESDAIIAAKGCLRDRTDYIMVRVREVKVEERVVCIISRPPTSFIVRYTQSEEEVTG